MPTQLLEGVADATPAEAAQVALRATRAPSLHWATLGIDFSLAGLLAGVLGKRVWMAELGRRGGSAKSEAKTAAARVNGRRGGRPERLRRRQYSRVAASPSEVNRRGESALAGLPGSGDGGIDVTGIYHAAGLTEMSAAVQVIGKLLAALGHAPKGFEIDLAG